MASLYRWLIGVIDYQVTKIMITNEELPDADCKICGGSGMCLYVDLGELNRLLPNGRYAVSDLYEKYGKREPCIDCMPRTYLKQKLNDN